MALTKVDNSLLETTGVASASTYLRGDGAWTAIASGGFDDLVSFTSTQSYTIPASITKQVFIVTGSGGGAGGSSGGYFASAGSAGGTVIKKLALAAGSVIQITVGIAGTGGATTANGVDGGDVTVATTSGTSFATLTGPGGMRGMYNERPNAQTVPSGGDINLAGGYAGSYYGVGGSSYWGGGGSGGFNDTAARDALVPGSGGGGSMTGGSTSFVGADGAVGIVVIHLYK